jgi:anthranilate phosphoribosyltransferase
LEVYKEYGFKNAIVFSSSDDGVHFLDEISVSGTVNIVGMRNSQVGKLISTKISNEFPFLSSYTVSDLAEKEEKIENVRCSLKVLNNTGLESHIDAICLNAAVIILASGKVKSLKEGYFLAKKKIENGEVFKLFLDVVELYNGDVNKVYTLIK